MSSMGYLVRADLKKHLGESADESRTCFVLPPIDSKLSPADTAEKAFDLVVEALRTASRYPVVEETGRRRVFVEDLRPFRNSLLLEKDGWKCFSMRSA